MDFFRGWFRVLCVLSDSLVDLILRVLCSRRLVCLVDLLCGFFVFWVGFWV